MAGVRFVKGHGTENDFVVLPDPDGGLDLTAPRIRALCDRRRGLGADGVLRVVRSEHAPDGVDTAGTEWFMDYRNADGSTAEMCGNGIRVFAHYLRQAGLADTERWTIATRGGRFTVEDDGAGYRVDMGPARAVRAGALPQVSVDAQTWSAVGVLAPNPHAVVFVQSLDDAGPLRQVPRVEPAAAFPDGVNVEFVATLGVDHVVFRVFERGVGETRSCGTGACAVAWAVRRRDGDPEHAPQTLTVDVAGGRLLVTERGDGHLLLAGPAVLVAEGEIDQSWWKEHA